MLIMATVDDMPPEGIPYITDKVMDNGAKNIHIINAYTKKGRMECLMLLLGNFGVLLLVSFMANM